MADQYDYQTSEYDTTGTDYANQGDGTYADGYYDSEGNYVDSQGNYGDYVEEKQSVFGLSSILVLALFCFLLYRGIVSTSGSVCSRGWVAMLFLPIAAGISYGLLKKVVSPSPSSSVYDEAGKVTGFFPKIFGSVGGGAASGNISRAITLSSFAIFMALFQVVVTSIILIFQKPEAPRSAIFKRALIAGGISLLFSAIFIIAITAVSTVIPVVRSILMLTEKLPFVGSLIGNNFYMFLAVSPLAMLGALTSYGISCSTL